MRSSWVSWRLADGLASVSYQPAPPVSKSGAHISDEAPLKIELKATGAKVEKDKLAYKDSMAKKSDAQPYPNPRFEVPFTASTAGKASIEAKMKFFVCTDKLCTPQQKTITLPVDVI